MKKSLKLFAIFTLIATFVAGLIAPFTAKAAEKIDTIKIGFVPSRNPDEIVTSTEPLKKLLKDELAKNGFEEDCKFCLQEDIYNIVPEYTNNSIKLKSII